MVEAAAIAGLMESHMLSHIFTGIVVAPGPIMNSATIPSR